MTDPFVSPDAYVADLQRRQRAADGLAKDLLTDVPMLYGSPGGMEPDGDPGIVIARLHLEELQRQHGGGAMPTKPLGLRDRGGVSLPLERPMMALALALLLLIALID